MTDIPIVNMAPDSKFDFTMPNWAKQLIADCIIIFGRVEQKTIEVVWVIEKSSGKERVQVARRPARENFEIALKFDQSKYKRNVGELIKEFNDLANLRNLIAHGCWLTVNDVPWVVWHKFIVDDGSVIGEFCSRDRLVAFKREANKILAMLSEIHLSVENAAGVVTSALTKLGQTVS